jgi:predicted nucleotidyltransferase
MKQQIIKETKKILSQKGVKRAGIFGSYATGKQTKNSDIDILVEISDEFSLLDLVRIKRELEKKLKKQVDLVEYSTLHPAIKSTALKEEVRII